MEKGVKDFAQNVEQLVDRVVSGDLALELTQHADKMVSGFIRGFEVRPRRLTCSLCSLHSTPTRWRSASSAALRRDQHVSCAVSGFIC